MSKSTKPAATGQTTALSVSGQFDESKVPAMLDQVNAKIKSLRGGDTPPVRITNSLGNFGVISSIKDPATLRGAYAYITKKAEANDQFTPVFQKAVPSVKLPSFTENGHTLEQWQNEILTQYSAATNEQQLEKLEKIKTELEGLLSEQDKKAAKIANVARLLDMED